MVTSGHAGSSPLSQDGSWRQRIDEARLDHDPVWLTLLAYRPLPLHAGWKSQADDPGFFLSPQGRHDPRAEMLADVEAMFFDTESRLGADASARCRFPARFTWLQRKLGLAAGVDVRTHCPALGAWYASVAADRVFIDFASAYLESPSSLFGHTFLRFAKTGVPTLMSATSNYEADSAARTGSIAFVVRGLFGGFPGIAEQRPFYRRLRVYGDIEGRDIREYPLELDAGEIDFLLLSLWEERDGTFDYYFVGENCSYRTLALIAAVRPDAKLLEDFRLEAVPIETIRSLQRRGFVGEPTFWPSAVRTLLWHTRDLSIKDRRTVVAIARGVEGPGVVAQRPREIRARLLDAAAEYSSILIHRGELDFETRERVTQDLIRERLALDAATLPDPPPAPPSPDTGHGGRMLALGWASEHGENGVELAVAGFHHERIDRLAGYEKGAEIAVLDARVRFTEDGDVRVGNFDLLRIESTTASGMFFQPPAWALRLGAVRKDVDHGRPLLGTLSYSRGRAFDIGAGVLALSVGASLDSGSALRGGVAMETVAGVKLTRQSTRLGYEGFLEYGRYLFGEHSDRLEYGMRVGVPLTRQQGLVLEFRRGGADSQQNTARIELRMFF